MKKIIITESQFKRLLKEAVTEAAVDREFHFLPLSNLVSVIEGDEFWLSGAEYDHNQYSLSLSRARTNQHGFQYSLYGRDNRAFTTGDNYARIEFNGQALNNLRNVSIKPFDFTYAQGGGYDGPMNGKQMHRYEYDNGYDYNGPDDPDGIKRQFWAQSEDRLVAPYDTIKNPLKYITRIDVMIRDNTKRDFEHFNEVLAQHPEWKRIVYFHTENKTFNRPAAEEE